MGQRLITQQRFTHTVQIIMDFPTPAPYKPQHALRIVTSTALFDGHDAAINIMRRILQSSGAEIIHLGHNRSAAEIVTCALQEDAQGIAITSYQGGHIEFFKYIKDLLNQAGAGHIHVFGGGGGTIHPAEIQELEAYGITKIYTPDDGRAMGLQGMINHLLQKCDYDVRLFKHQLAGSIDADDFLESYVEALQDKDERALARLISHCEYSDTEAQEVRRLIEPRLSSLTTPVLGITGTGGAGKSSLIDELARRFSLSYPDKRLAIISVDPSRKKSGGALLGDRIRMNSLHTFGIFMRSMATRQSNLSLSKYVSDAVNLAKVAGYDLVILETSGIGQSDTQIVDHADVSLYVMTPEYGAATQLEKIDMLDFADVIAINKFDKKGSLDALRDVRKQFVRNRQLWTTPEDALPVVGTRASQFNDEGMDALFRTLMAHLDAKQLGVFPEPQLPRAPLQAQIVLPADRTNYLCEIADLNRMYGEFVEAQALLASKLYRLQGAIETLEVNLENEAVLKTLHAQYADAQNRMDGECRMVLNNWKYLVAKYATDTYSYKVRDKVIDQKFVTTTLSGTKIPKVALPKFSDWGDILRWRLLENVPGKFPYAAGVFPLKREGEDPTRMFAGEGHAERTNRRFHYVSQGLPAKRLSTAFDSVTLYGEDPGLRPDIYGKIGNSGVSISTLDDAKRLYSGFNLSSASTSVSMTINGPAPMVLAFFLNAAIDQQVEQYLVQEGKLQEARNKIAALYEQANLPIPQYEGALPDGNDGLGLALLGIPGDAVVAPEVYQKIKADTLMAVRGTVQADILKEDQAQNTCIFSTEFALRMMGDIQQYFIDKKVRNFYSVSISGYHIAEAGANPITQLALTLANGFTYVEYYLSRGMRIDDFAPNLSFFFSNGTDIEYAVIGRVARRIWAKALKHRYKANDRSQKLKYHIQTSGRSLHAQEIAFNDIRTTLQALYAIYDNCNSLHTNAYDEAITTPTEESVRRAMAIQLILNKEFGMNLNENVMQGSFIMEELADLVEEAVLTEFRRLSDRGGVLGAMERMYQRNKIQDESLLYETLKHEGKIEIVGVNTFLDKKGSPTIIPEEVVRSTPEERALTIENNNNFKTKNEVKAQEALLSLQKVAAEGGNIFEELMETVKYSTLGQISQALYLVGGQYRRNM